MYCLVIAAKQLCVCVCVHLHPSVGGVEGRGGIKSCYIIYEYYL